MINHIRRITILALLLLHVSVIYAQIKITGKVTDAFNGEAVPGVSVTVGKDGTVTNADGHYSLSVTPNDDSNFELNFSCIGYVTKQVIVREKKSQTINVKISSDQKLLNEIVVNGLPYDMGVRSPQMGAVSVTGSQIKNLPVVFGEPDLLKTLQTTPGVQSGKTGNAGIMVRGGNFDQNSLMIDGGIFYSSEHMRGFVSAINPDMVSTLAFYRGAFPAKYSGRLSGIIDISAKEGDLYTYHGDISVGAAMGRFDVSGPIIKGRTAFSVAARMSYFGLLYQKVVEHHYDKIGQECPYSNMEFWDVNAKVTHRFTPNDKLSLTLIKDHDTQDIPARTGTGSTTSTSYYIDENGNGFAATLPVDDAILVGRSVSKSSSKPLGDKTWWGNTLATMNYSHRWDGSDGMLNLTAAFSEYKYERSQEGSLLKEDFITYDQPFDKIYQDSVVTSYSEMSRLTSISRVRSLRAAASVNHPAGKNNRLAFGVEFRHGWYDPKRHIQSHVDDYKNWSVVDKVTGDVLIDHRDEMTVTDTDTVVGASHRLSSFNAYVSDELRYDRFSANVGVNLAVYHAGGKTYAYPEPRVALNYMLTANTSIKGSVMQVSQAERLLSSISLVSPNDIWVPATDSVPPMRSTQFALSLNHQLPYGIDISVEGYYKTIKGNIDYIEGTDFNSISSTWQDQITIGRSRSYGVEVLLQKFSGSTNGWISYTWSRTFDKFDAPGKAISNGIEIPALADRPHNLSVSLSQRWGGIIKYPRNHFDLSMLFKYVSGRRVTIPDHISYAGMMSVADHYMSFHQGAVYDSHLGNYTDQYGTATLPSDAFDLFMRFNGYSQRYNYVLPYEMTLDLNLSFTMCHRTGVSRLSLGVTNVLNRKNVSSVYMSRYADGKQVLVGVCDFPITPSLSYTYSF